MRQAFSSRSIASPREVIPGGRADHVKSAESLDAAVGGGRDTRKVAHVDDLSVHPRTGVGHQRRRLVKVGRSAVRDHHRVDRAAHVQRHNVGALLCEPHGLCAADPARRAGDQGDLPGQPARSCGLLR